MKKNLNLSIKLNVPNQAQKPLVMPRIKDYSPSLKEMSTKMNFLTGQIKKKQKPPIVNVDMKPLSLIASHLKSLKNEVVKMRKESGKPDNVLHSKLSSLISKVSNIKPVSKTVHRTVERRVITNVKKRVVKKKPSVPSEKKSMLITVLTQPTIIPAGG